MAGPASRRARTADYPWSALRRLLSWAYDRGSISVNHAARALAACSIAIVPTSYWLPEHVDAFCNVVFPNFGSRSCSPSIPASARVICYG